MEERKKYAIEEIANEDIKLEVYLNMYIEQKDKRAVAAALCKICCINKNGYINYISVDRNMLEYLIMINLYTNIEVAEYTEEYYDKLKSLQIDVSDIPDVITFHKLIDDYINDMLQANTIESIVAENLSKLNALASDIGEHINIMLDKGDPNKIAKYLSKGVEEIAKKLPDFSKMEIDSVKESLNSMKGKLN